MVGGMVLHRGKHQLQHGHAIFEATHGTAPDIAGQKQTHASMLLSGDDA